MVAPGHPRNPGEAHVPPSTEFRALRDREFPFVARAPYLNAASVAPLPERARRALDERNLRRSDVHALRGDDFEPTLERARRAAAALVNGGEDEIALLPNTSFGINLAARALPLEPGRRVLVSEGEFPANVYPWMALERSRGARVELLPRTAAGAPDEARMIAEVERGDVGIVAVSAVQFADGWVADLAALGRACARHGAWLVVDAIQALGQLPMDPRAAGVHVLATGGHKWLCSPFGTGFAWIARELVERMEPATVGWAQMAASADLERVTDYDYRWVEGARRFEVATLPFHDYAAFAESLELIAEAGPTAIRAHVLTLLEPLAGFLAARGAGVDGGAGRERRSGILAFRSSDTEAAYRALAAAGVACVLREGAVRLSPHLYNQPEDVDRVMEALDGVLPR
jgi:cysteine desulfurase/selenocysteine lyase